MLESSFGLTFFLKVPRNKGSIRSVYLRITVDGVPKETSIKRLWDMNRWSQKEERAVGNKEDAKVLNSFLDLLQGQVNQYKNDLIYSQQSISSEKIINFISGRNVSRTKVLEEFELHNYEVLALVDKKEYAIGTYKRFEVAIKHAREFIFFKYRLKDMEFKDLNYEFVKDYEFYLKTVKNCNNNTALKYISQLKKIVMRAIDKEIILKDPFRTFKGRKTKTKKKPLTAQELCTIENHNFATERLNTVRDIFIFQCYTGLAYVDVLQLKTSNIKIGLNGEKWIMSERQKTGQETNIPLLPKALEIMKKYKEHPLCLERRTVLPVISNQKMNEYLKEIADLCGLDVILNTHKARRTFGSTVTLGNDVPIHVVKEMLGHSSVKQTEEYAITEQAAIGREMQGLKERLADKEDVSGNLTLQTIERMEKELIEMKKKLALMNRN